MNKQAEHDGVTKILHWLMAWLFLGMFMVAYVMINIQKSDFRLSLYDLHKATGLLLFLLVMVRLWWRVNHARPSANITTWQGALAIGVAVLLYLLMVGMPISGFLTSTLGGHEVKFFGLLTIKPLAMDKLRSEYFSGVHEVLSYLMIGCFILHVAGALYHHYYLKDNVLKQMLGRRYEITK